jgi:hypothetical protein
MGYRLDVVSEVAQEWRQAYVSALVDQEIHA